MEHQDYKTYPIIDSSAYFRTNTVIVPEMPEYNSGAILVQPDLSYSVSEIIDKFTRGISLPIGAQNGYYDSDINENLDFDDMPETDVPNFDLSDASRILNETEIFNENLSKHKLRKQKEIEATKTTAETVE